MTTDDATRLMAQLTAAFPNAVPPEATIDAYYEHLEPLPADAVAQGVRRLIAGLGRSEKAQPFFPSIPELLDAVGIFGAGRAELLRAIAQKGHLMPTIRTVGDNLSGWEFVPRHGPLPLGVAQALAVAGKPLPEGMTVASPPALMPATPALRSGEPMRPGTALATIGQGLQQRKDAALRRAYEEQRDGPPPATAYDRALMPPVLRQAVEAAEAEQARLEQARHRCEAQERAYREMCDEIRDDQRARVVDGATAKAVARELLAGLMVDPLQGFEAVVGVLRDAVAPGLAIAKAELAHGPNPDVFDDAPGPVVAVRVAFKRET